MRLAEFIETKREAIMADWEEFARTCTPASGVMDIVALRDHASEMLTVIADDLKTPQGHVAQAQKSKGQAPDDDTAGATAAEEHGAGRAESGFTVEQMVSEYRALRASVIRLWTKEEGTLKTENLDDLTRFNEAVDQSLAESVSRYTQDLDRSKEMFLAILGHDLRNPLNAIIMSASFMLEMRELREPNLTLTSRIAKSAHRMNRMVGDLLDFTRSRLGGIIPVTRKDMSMEKSVRDVVEEIAAAHPHRTITVESRGDTRGEWDCARINQVMTNLTGNALEHGSVGTAVSISLQGEGDQVRIAIHNRGPAIPPRQLRGIFNPMKTQQSLKGGPSSGPTGHLGLGLYIADRIVCAHKGRIDVDSSEAQGTTFTVHLPRH